MKKTTANWLASAEYDLRTATQRSTPRAELTAFCEQLRRAHVRPERLLLFGSWARGEQREESDIDLVVISRDFARLSDLRRLETLGIAAGRARVSVEAHGYTPEEFAAPEPTSFLAIVLSQKTVEIPVRRGRHPLNKTARRRRAAA